jgi:hypothetical protein
MQITFPTPLHPLLLECRHLPGHLHEQQHRQETLRARLIPAIYEYK